MIWPCAMNGNITIFSFVGAIFEGWIETKNQEGERGGGGEGEREICFLLIYRVAVGQ